MIGKSVPAFGRAHDGSAGPDNGRRGGDPLHRLIEVLVERVSRPRGDDDLEQRRDRAHRQFAGQLPGLGMHLKHWAAEGLDDGLLPVEDHIESEVHLADRPHHGPDIVVDRVSLADPPRGPPVADALRVVQRQDGVQPRQARCDQLRAAAEPGEEVRFDESGGDADVRVNPAFVQPDRYAVPVDAQVDQRVAVPGVVVDDFHAVRDLVPHHLADLLR